MERAYRNLGYVLIVLVPIFIAGFWIPYLSEIPHFDESITAAVHIHAASAVLLSWLADRSAAGDTLPGIFHASRSGEAVEHLDPDCSRVLGDDVVQGISRASERGRNDAHGSQLRVSIGGSACSFCESLRGIDPGDSHAQCRDTYASHDLHCVDPVAGGYGKDARLLVRHAAIRVADGLPCADRCVPGFPYCVRPATPVLRSPLHHGARGVHRDRGHLDHARAPSLI